MARSSRHQVPPTLPQPNPSSMNHKVRPPPPPPLPPLTLTPLSPPLPSLYLNGGGHEDQMYLLESVARPVPPPPAPPSTPVVKQVTKKYHNQLLQQLPKMLANGINLSRPEDYMWLDPSGRPTSPPRTMSPQNQAQSTRKVCMYYRVCHICLDFKVSRYIEGYSLKKK